MFSYEILSIITGALHILSSSPIFSKSLPYPKLPYPKLRVGVGNSFGIRVERGKIKDLGDGVGNSFGIRGRVGPAKAGRENRRYL